MTPELITIERVALLHRVDFFAGVPSQALAAMAQRADEVSAANGESIIDEGDEGDCLYVIVRGRVAVAAGGRVVAELGAGEVVGELSVLSPERRNATVTATEPSLFLRVGADVLAELLLDHPAVTRGIIDVLVRRLRRTVSLQ